MRRLARAAAVAATLVSCLGVGTTASASAPVRTGWWNTLSAGEDTAPAPTTPAGGLRVSAASGVVLAYGAVLYPAPSGASGRLTLALAGSQGAVALAACPTTSSTWPAGGNQPSDTAPAYDCSRYRFPGVVSADGKTVSFTVSTAGAPVAGVLSLAVVPDPGATTTPASAVTFSVDLDKPGPQSLALSTSPPPQAPTGGDSAGTATTTMQPVPAGAPLGLPRNVPTPPASGPAEPPLFIAPQLAATPSPAAAPVAAPSRRTASAAAGSIIGGIAMVAALLFWGLGRGLLGGRIVPLSVRLDRSVAP